MRSSALIPLTRIPTAAVHDMAAPLTSGVFTNFWQLSTSIMLTAASSRTALRRDISMEVFL